MYINTFIKLEKILNIIIISLFFLSISKGTFGTSGDNLDDESRGHIISHPLAGEMSVSLQEESEENDSSLSNAGDLMPPAVISLEAENPSFETDIDTEIRQRLGQAITSIFTENSEVSSAQFSFRELPPFLGGASGVPLSTFAIKKAGDSLFLKAYFTGATITSVGLTRIWALDALLNEEWKHSKSKVSTHVLVNITSVLSTFPLTYAVWKNTNNIILTGINFISEWSLSTLGFYEFSNNVKFQNTSYQRLPNLVNLNLPVRQFFRHLISQPNPDRFAEEFFSSLNTASNSDDEATNPLIVLDHIPNSLFKNGTKAIFYIVPISSLIVNSVLSYKSINDYTSSLFMVVPYVAVTTLPSFALQMYTTSSTVDDLWGDTVNKRSYLKVKSQKLFYTLGGLSLLLSIGSSLWGVDVVEDALKGTFLESAVPFFMFTTASQLIIFEAHCIRDYFAKKYFHWKEVRGTEQEKNTTTLFKILVEINDNSTSVLSNDYAWYNPIGWYKKVLSYIRR